MLISIFENKKISEKKLYKKFYIFYLAGYPVSGKILAGYPAKSVSGTTTTLSVTIYCPPCIVKFGPAAEPGRVLEVEVLQLLRLVRQDQHRTFHLSGTEITFLYNFILYLPKIL